MKELAKLARENPVRLVMGIATGVALYFFLNGVYTGVKSAITEL